MNALLTSTHSSLAFALGPFNAAADITAFATAETPDPNLIPDDADAEAAGAVPMTGFTVTTAPASTAAQPVVPSWMT